MGRHGIVSFQGTSEEMRSYEFPQVFSRISDVANELKREVRDLDTLFS